MGNTELNRYNRLIDSMFRGLWGGMPYDFKDKSNAIWQHIAYMLTRTQSMFEWRGLPDTIPAYQLELYLQMNGNACICEHGNNLYAFIGGMGGEPDVYYRPTLYTISNPALNFDAQLKIDTECVLIRNDPFCTGLLPLFTRCATGIAETELSIDIAAVNSRIVSLITATTDSAYQSALDYLADIRAGESGVMMKPEMLEGIKAQPYATTGNRSITDLIELLQYQKASWYNEIGINANYNMKRESINAGESQLNNDALYPLVDTMLDCRKRGAEKINALYDLQVTVDLKSTWRDNQREVDAELKQMEGEWGETDVKETPT